jgi:NAD(P) transhydrogenase subunit alpha
MTNFLKLLVKDGALNIDMNDEIIKGSCVAFEGDVMNERVAAALSARPVHS